MILDCPSCHATNNIAGLYLGTAPPLQASGKQSPRLVRCWKCGKVWEVQDNPFREPAPQEKSS